MYERMLAAGAQPTATTYTALISAYGKNGQLDKALQIFQDMVRHGPAGLQHIGEQHGHIAAHSVPAQIQLSPGGCTSLIGQHLAPLPLAEQHPRATCYISNVL